MPSLTQRGAAGYTPGAAYRHWSSQEAFERDVLAEALCRHPGASVIETVANIRDRVDDGAELQGEIQAGAQANVHIRPQNANYFALLALRTIVSHDTELRAVRLERLMTGLSEYSYLYEAMLKVQQRRLRSPLPRGSTWTLFAVVVDAIGDVHGTRRVTERFHDWFAADLWLNTPARCSADVQQRRATLASTGNTRDHDEGANLHVQTDPHQQGDRGSPPPFSRPAER